MCDQALERRPGALNSAMAIAPAAGLLLRAPLLLRASRRLSSSAAGVPGVPHLAAFSPPRRSPSRIQRRRQSQGRNRAEMAPPGVPSGEQAAVAEARDLVAELCRHFYTLGWVSGTGGSISIKINTQDKPMKDRLIVMAPSGVQKERMIPEDMYVLAPDGSVLEEPVTKPPPHKPPKCSECGPLFLKCYELRDAGAVIHSHGMETAIVTMLKPGAKEFRISHMEMIKGILGHGYYDELVVPIIENTAREYELTESLAAAIEAYPKATAVLVRNHGIYVWGPNWIAAKTQAECYHYLFEAAIKMHELGLNPTDPLHAPLRPSKALANGDISGDVSTLPSKKRPRNSSANGLHSSPSVVILDIEGTTTPISFVADTLFPYAKSHAAEHLLSTYDNEETQADIALLRTQIEEDVKAGVPGAAPVPLPAAGKEAVVGALAQNIDAMIKADRKVTALKQLQGHIWRVGYAKGELKGEFFSDVLTALAQWHQAGTKIFVYSSGSREAQRLIFGYSNVGDLRPYISAYFDTTTGNKRESRSYSEIALSIGVDSPSEALFCTDILQEALAAKDADGAVSPMAYEPYWTYGPRFPGASRPSSGLELSRALQDGAERSGRAGGSGVLMKPITSAYLGQDDDIPPAGRGSIGVMDMDFDNDMELVDNGAGAVGSKKQLLDADFFNSFPDDFDEDDLEHEGGIVAR